MRWLLLPSIAGSVVALLIAASAQAQSDKLPMVGWLRVASPEMSPGKPLRAALSVRGMVDGEHYQLDIRVAEGQPERLPELPRSLARDRPAVIVAFGPDEARAATENQPADEVIE